VRGTPSLLDKQAVAFLRLTSVEVDHQRCTALPQHTAVADVVARLQTGFPDTHLVADVQPFEWRAQQLMSSLQVAVVALGLPQTQ
jgi:hypothetical protein